MAVKMCKINELTDAGWSCNQSIINNLGGGGRCPTVDVFLKNFHKTNEVASIKGRAGNQLFPITDIMIIADMTWDSMTDINCLGKETGDVSTFRGDDWILIDCAGEEYISFSVATSTGIVSLSSAGLEIFDIRYTDTESDGISYLNFKIKVIDSSKLPKGNRITFVATAKGTNGRNVSEIFYVDYCDGGGSTEPTETANIIVTPNELTITTYDGVDFEVLCKNIKSGTLSFESELTDKPDEVTITINEYRDFETSGKAQLLVYQIGASSFIPRNVPIVVKGESSITGNTVRSNEVYVNFAN